MAVRWRLTLLDRYLWRSLISTHVVFSLLFILIVILSNIWYFAPEWLRLGLSILDIFVMILFFIPGALLQATSVALVMALLVVVARAQFYHEIDAMRSLGASMLRIFKPIFLYSLMIFLGMLGIAFLIYPWSMNSFKRYYARVLSQQVGIRLDTAEPKQLGGLTLYVHNEGEVWLISEERNGYRLLLWAYDGEIAEQDDLRFMLSDNANLLLVESNINGGQWHWAEVTNIHYPLTFDIQAISYNPYDDLLLPDLISEYRQLRGEYTRYKQLQQERLAELKRLLNTPRLNENDANLYSQEISSIESDNEISSDLVSAQFVIYLRVSHSLLVLVLIFLAYAMLMRHAIHLKWSVFVVVLSTLGFYWMIFYAISREILRMEIAAYWLFTPIFALSVLGLLLWARELRIYLRSRY